MKEYVLNYYPLFRCIAEKCKHTCCAGWEMNIDEQTLTNYKGYEGEFSSALKSGINYKKSKFRTDKFKRCAFLNEEGLCEIIINLGEKSLCQVCTDHPRFRGFFEDRTETGLGFCCEEAARIVLSFKGKIEPIMISDDRAEIELDINERNLLQFREKALNIVQDRTVNVNQRIENLLALCNANFLEEDFKKVIKTFLSLEKIDKEWTKKLKSITKTSFDKSTDQDLSLYCEQFLVNGLYRHLSDAEDTMWVRARTIALIFSWWVVKSVVNLERTKTVNLLETTIDAVRSFSAEVEYSQKNLDKLFNFCYKFIKI
ncbi:MAG: flagellin lysine-N-methylase [Clostridia bacterium]|nr:flagellin lysine-N-methylase [Clostridia bacterium]